MVKFFFINKILILEVVAHVHQQPCGNQGLVSVPDPKPTPARITFPHVILEVIYALDEVWGRD